MKAVIWGTVGAIAVRVITTLAVVALLKDPRVEACRRSAVDLDRLQTTGRGRGGASRAGECCADRHLLVRPSHHHHRGCRDGLGQRTRSGGRCSWQLPSCSVGIAHQHPDHGVGKYARPADCRSLSHDHLSGGRSAGMDRRGNDRGRAVGPGFSRGRELPWASPGWNGLSTLRWWAVSSSGVGCTSALPPLAGQKDRGSRTRLFGRGRSRDPLSTRQSDRTVTRNETD